MCFHDRESSPMGRPGSLLGSSGSEERSERSRRAPPRLSERFPVFSPFSLVPNLEESRLSCNAMHTKFLGEPTGTKRVKTGPEKGGCAYRHDTAMMFNLRQRDEFRF